MRSTVVLLLLGCCLTGAQLQNGGGGITQRNLQPDIWIELKELRDIVVEQRVKLQSVESQVVELKTENKAQAVDLRAMEDRANSTELQLEEQKTVVEELKSTVEELKRENADRPKVAFSAALTNAGEVGPSYEDATLVYKKYSQILAITTAQTQWFSSDTGIFTAPVRGVYYFRFTAFASGSSINIGSVLYKNGNHIVTVFDYQGFGERDDYSSNAAVLQLEVGDQVYMLLPAGYQVYDSHFNRCSFSGFLLFPL